ncbi:S8 family serine peptidase [Exilibacterium tricleocarpae]|uniref:S8 family serine peptidase n=1 Tax=Exilibacterium tricleocarpae TaxID=2591008 RepID=A0A545SND1_9GAMM|nr:S8 family peptidase [Exilibacterium tricleocarpae]TQV66500.1 S8 family serine peptidase [Exilibacterium tricleocarpae]
MKNNSLPVGLLKKLVLGGAVALSATSVSVQAVQLDSTAAASPVPAAAAAITDRIIVKYKNTAPESLSATLSQASLDRAEQLAGAGLKHMRKLATGAHLVKLKRQLTGAEVDDVIAKLMADPNVEYAERDIMLRPMAIPSDPRYSEQWHYFENAGGLNLPAAWDVTQGEGVVVAVIDTGYRPHSDLNANLLPGYDMISDTTVAQDGGGRDADARDPGDWEPAGACGAGEPARNSSWHGTHVAGTIAAVTNNGVGIAGVAYKAKVVPIRALGRCGGLLSDISDAMIWAAGGSVSGVPANANPAQVLNLSLGGGGSCGATQQAAINTARSLGATVVVAAGNSNANAANATPANCAGVVTVASVDRSGGKAWYSNFGSVVDVAAPGGDTRFAAANGVLSTLNSGTTGPGSESYAFFQGTSMATPHVAGAAALLYAVQPGITPDAVESILKSSARSFPATCSQCGAGIVDAAAAVDAANGGGGGTPDGVLENGVVETGLSGSTGTELFFTLEVPAGAGDLSFQLSGGSGDADLYVKFGSAPTTGSYDCRPFVSGNNETCDISSARAGTYYVMVRAYSTFSGVSLVGSFTEGGGGGISETDLSGARFSWTRYTIEVAPGSTALEVSIAGGSGDADLYVRAGAAPTLSAYNCRPYRNGNNETCSIANPQAGTWHIGLYGYAAYSGVSLEAN